MVSQRRGDEISKK